MVVLAYDMGGTKIECALFELSESDKQEAFPLKKLVSKRIATEKNKNFETILNNIASATLQIMEEAGVQKSHLARVGLSLNGSICPRTGIFLNGGTPSFVGHNVGKSLMKALNLNIPLSQGNDANCFALAETVLGAARKYKESGSVLGVILGTGLGGGFVSDGKFVSGARGAGFEIGHIPFTFHNFQCYCGASGCSETVISGQGLQRYYHHLSKKTASCEDIVLLYSEQDNHAVSAVQEFRRNIAYFLGQVTNLLDPSAFVFGGGLSNVKLLFQGVQKQMQEYLFVKERPPELLFNELGDSSGILGACLLGSR